MFDVDLVSSLVFQGCPGNRREKQQEWVEGRQSSASSPHGPTCALGMDSLEEIAM